MRVAPIVELPAASGSQQGIGSEVPGIVVVVVLIVAVIAGVAGIFHPAGGARVFELSGSPAAGVVALYVVGRSIAEFLDCELLRPR